MQWEHACLVRKTDVLPLSQGVTETFTFYGPDREGELDAMGSDSVGLLNMLGEYGWELVSVETKYPPGIGNAGVTERQFWLKRPKGSGTE